MHGMFQFCRNEGLTISDCELLSGCDVYTYFSDTYEVTSWLDHLFCTTSAFEIVELNSETVGLNMVKLVMMVQLFTCTNFRIII